MKPQAYACGFFYITKDDFGREAYLRYRSIKAMQKKVASFQ
jgi:hypothetical protein